MLADQWRVPISKTFRFIGERTPSKILRDFLDRLSQSLDSGVEHREFIEHEQDAVLQEYKTIYEASNENIVILSEVYVSLLIAIIFVMSMAIVLPMIMGSQDMGSSIYVSSFMLLASEGMLIYLLRSMIPPDEMWHSTVENGEIELSLLKTFKKTLFLSILLLIVILHYHHIAHEFANHGISVINLAVDIARMIERKDGIVKKLTGGVAQLLKGNKVEFFHGKGQLLAGRRVEVTPVGGSPAISLQADNVILASGSVPIAIPNVAFDGEFIVDNVGALSFSSVPRRLGVTWPRRYRARIGLRMEPVGQRGGLAGGA